MREAVFWQPDADFAAATNLARFLRAAGLADEDALAARAAADPEWFWDALIRFLDIRFRRPYRRVLDLSEGIEFPRWCVGGATNLADNALDRLDAAARTRTALIGESEAGAVRAWSYAELDGQTCRLAAGLAALGLTRGDVVGVFLPMLPELVAAFLACAKLGLIMLPLFTGFGPEAVAQRLALGGAVAVFTVDATRRRGETIALKPVIDAAAEALPALRHVIVLRQEPAAVPMRPGRDHFWHDLVAGRPDRFATAELDAEQPLLIVYTSGTTGLPKGTVHTHCGLAVKIAQDTQLHFDLKSDDRMLWMSDFGWFVGPIQIVGCLLAGCTLVLAEGAPDHPDPGRVWRLIERHRVTQFGIGPTLARTLRRSADAARAAHDLSSLRIAFSTGEPWDTETWLWVFNAVLGGRAPIVNYSGGTEMVGIIASSLLRPIRPASFAGGIAGTGADIVDADGRTVPPGVIGELVMREPCIGTTRGLWRDRERYLDSYWRRIPGMWVHGDLASRDADGYWYLHGRSDDTLKISGKRTGPAEIEERLMAAGGVREAAAIGLPDPVKGSALVCVAVPLPGEDEAALAEKLSAAVVAGLGRSFRPREVLFVPDLPKTRSMKVMRRVIRAVLAGEEAGDLSSLVNPESLEALRRLRAP